MNILWQTKIFVWKDGSTLFALNKIVSLRRCSREKHFLSRIKLRPSVATGIPATPRHQEREGQILSHSRRSTDRNVGTLSFFKLMLRKLIHIIVKENKHDSMGAENLTCFSTYTRRWIRGIVCGAIDGSWSEMSSNRLTHDHYRNPCAPRVNECAVKCDKTAFSLSLLCSGCPISR